MKLKRILAIALLMAVLVSVAACSGAQSKSIIGTWKEAKTGVTVTFEKDGKCKFPIVGALSIDCNYKLEGDKLTIWTELIGQKIEIKSTVSVNGDKMTVITEGVATEYDKVN